jgi:hypothetical protein
MRELHAPCQQSNPVKPSQSSLTGELWFDSFKPLQVVFDGMPCRHLSPFVGILPDASSGSPLSPFDHRTAWYRFIPVGIGYEAKNSP